MKLRIHLKSLFGAVVTGILLASGPTASRVAMAATSYVVNDGGADCGSFVATYTVLQTAVSDAIDHHVKTVLVCPGSYSDFDVFGVNKLTIKAALPGTFPVVNAPADVVGTAIDVQNSSGVVLDGLKVDGSTFNDALSSSSSGISFYNASGTVQNSTITRVRCFPSSCSRGYGIYFVDNNLDGKASTLTVKTTNISDVDYAGIYASGQVKISVTGGRIIGNLSGGGANPYGIYLEGSGVAGSVTKNMISQIFSGVTLSGVSKATVSGNTVAESGVGVIITSYCSAGLETASSNKVTNNTFSDNGFESVSLLSNGASCSHTDKNTISGNHMSGWGAAGVKFDITTDAFSDKNKVSGNTIFGFTTDIIKDADATNTTFSKNTWIP